MPWGHQDANSLCLGAQDAARFSPGTSSYHQGRCEFAGGKLEDAEGDYAARNYATSVCWGDERRLEASRQWANARVQAAMDMQAGCRLHSSRVQNFSVLSFLASSGMFLQECSHSYETKAVVDDYFLGQPGDAQSLWNRTGGGKPM